MLTIIPKHGECHTCKRRTSILITIVYCNIDFPEHVKLLFLVVSRLVKCLIPIFDLHEPPYPFLRCIGNATFQRNPTKLVDQKNNSMYEFSLEIPQGVVSPNNFEVIEHVRVSFFYENGRVLTKMSRLAL